VQSSAMNTGDWISAVLAIVQIAAIVIGAVWAYWKFFKGRIFHKRAEPIVDATLLRTGSSYAIRARTTLKNTGSSDVPLRVTLLTVASYVTGDVDEYGRPQWPEVARAHAFKDHEGVESQETIIDDVLIPLRKDDGPGRTSILAYLITCKVFERRGEPRFRDRAYAMLLQRELKVGGGICWTTKTVVPAAMEVVSPHDDSASEETPAKEE
jgi:hypothetical protein